MQTQQETPVPCPPRRTGTVTHYDHDTGRGRIRAGALTFKFGNKRNYLAVGVVVSFRAGIVRAYHVRRAQGDELP